MKKIKAPPSEVLAKAEELKAQGYALRKGRAPKGKSVGKFLIPALAQHFGVSPRYINIILNRKVPDPAPLPSVVEPVPQGPRRPANAMLDMQKAFDAFVDDYVSMGAENFPSSFLDWVEKGAHLMEKFISSKGIK